MDVHVRDAEGFYVFGEISSEVMIVAIRSFPFKKSTKSGVSAEQRKTGDYE